MVSADAFCGQRIAHFFSELGGDRYSNDVYIEGVVWIIRNALAHMGKPEVETLSTIFGGFAFGWVAWRTKSFLYPFLIHWFISTFIILVAAGVV